MENKSSVCSRNNILFLFALAVGGLYYVIGENSIVQAEDGSREISIVQTEDGPVKGYVLDGDHGVKYISFKGVPYSEQPVGDLRFEPLEPTKPWKDVYDAKSETPICIQRKKIFHYWQTQPMSEACLGANIYVPAKRPAGQLLPVLVFVYGGAFNYLSSDSDVYGPEYLMAKDIVVVTFNYRMNLFGFLSLDIPEAPGNLGLKDQLFFLKWVRRNIASFGGNPDEVTLGAMSAGASGVHVLTLSPQAKGLFKRVIMHSGNAFSSYMSLSTAYTNKLNSDMNKLLGIESSNPHEIFKILKNMNNETLTVATDKLLDAYGILTYAPVLEKRFQGIEPILEKKPFEIMQSKRYIDVPHLIGFTSEDALIFEHRLQELNFIETLKSNPFLTLPLDLLFNSKPEELPQLLRKFTERYFKSNQSDYEKLHSFINLATDSMFIYPTLRLAKFNAINSRSPTYLYRFSFDGIHNLVTRAVAATSITGAGHADDISYLFKANYYGKDIEPNTPEEMTKERMLEMWSNFIKFGNPTPEITERVTVKWPKTDADSLVYMNIDKELTINRHPYPDVIDFYNQFYPVISQQGEL